MQLVLVLETRASCESDYRYIKSAIDFFYIERSFKLTKIFANNKTELIKQDKKISECKNKYNGETVVVICADYDRESDTLCFPGSSVYMPIAFCCFCCTIKSYGTAALTQKIVIIHRHMPYVKFRLFLHYLPVKTSI